MSVQADHIKDWTCLHITSSLLVSRTSALQCQPGKRIGAANIHHVGYVDVECRQDPCSNFFAVFTVCVY